MAMVNNGRSVPEVAGELGLIAQTLRNWVKSAEQGRLNEKATKVTEEQMELSRLRAENQTLPRYEADEGPLTERQAKAIRKLAHKVK